MAAEAQVSGVRKAAIALVAMGDDASSALFKHFHEDEIERIVREVATLGNISTEQNDQVLTELRQLAIAGASVTAGGVDQVRRLLAKSVSPDQSKRILDKVVSSAKTQAGFDSLDKANPQQLAKFVVGEHPQTIALILAHLNTANGALLLAQLPEDLRADVLMRMASLQDIPPDVIAHISSVIDQRLRGLGGMRREQRGGMRAVAELFNHLDKETSRSTLEQIEVASADVALGIRNLMFVFDDLVHIEAAGIREMINRADKRVLTVALKGASEPVRQHFLTNMSKRAADLQREEVESLGTVKLREVEKAQQEIVAIARTLEEEGVITLGDASGDSYVG
jgi:flagellar motor switch protein FliG